VAFVRYQNLKHASFLLIFTFFWGVTPSIASASVKIDAGKILNVIIDETRL
jgi:hypothetical protein